MLRRGRIRSEVPALGACFVTAEISVHGARVGYMYRERPEEIDDSGWRFMVGTETQDYMDDPANTLVVDVNRVAHHEPDIVPLLAAPVGSAFERVDGELRPCAPPDERETEPEQPGAHSPRR